MKKIFIVFTLLCVGVFSCLEVQATDELHYKVTYTNDDNVSSFQRQAKIMEFLKGTLTLAEAIADVNNHTYPSNGNHPTCVSKVCIIGSVGTETSALANINAETIDLSKATNVSVNFKNIHAKYILFPNNWGKQKVNDVAKAICEETGNNLESAISISNNTMTVKKWVYENTVGDKFAYSGDITDQDDDNGTGKGTVTTTVTPTLVSKVAHKINDDNTEGEEYTGKIIVKDGETYGTTSDVFFPLGSFSGVSRTSSPYETFTGYIRENGSNYKGVYQGNTPVQVFSGYNTEYIYASKYIFEGHPYTNIYNSTIVSGYIGGTNYPAQTGYNGYSYQNNGVFYAYTGETRSDGYNTYGVIGGTKVSLTSETSNNEVWVLSENTSTVYDGEYTRTDGDNIYAPVPYNGKLEDLKFEVTKETKEVWMNQWGSEYNNEYGEPVLQSDGTYRAVKDEWTSYGVSKQTITKYYKGTEVYTGYVYTSSNFSGKYFGFNNCADKQIIKKTLSVTTIYYETEDGNKVVYTGTVYSNNTGYIGGTETLLTVQTNATYYTKDNKQIIVTKYPEGNNNFNYASDDNYVNEGGTWTQLTIHNSTENYIIGQYNGKEAKQIFTGNVYTMRTESGIIVEKDLSLGYEDDQSEVDLAYRTTYYRNGDMNAIYNGNRTDDNLYGYESGNEFKVAVQYTYKYSTDLVPALTDKELVSSTPLETYEVTQDVDLKYEDFEEPTSRYDVIAYVNKPGTLQYSLQHAYQFESNYDTNGTSWIPTSTDGEPNHYSYKLSDGNGQFVGDLVISGRICARDINTTGAAMDVNGHYITSCLCTTAPSNIKPYSDAKYEMVKYIAQATKTYTDCPFSNVSFYELDMEDAEFVDEEGYYYPADMTLSALMHLNYNLYKVTLPTAESQFIIPDRCMEYATLISEQLIPRNYEEIHTYAFHGNSNGITHYTTIAGPDIDGKPEQYGVPAGNVIDNGDMTLTLSSNVKYLATGAFNSENGAHLFDDVYVLARTAPICDGWAFSKETCVGNNSDSGTCIIKGNYVNPDNGMAMLHFVATTEEQQRNYTDLTRNYDRYDEGGGTDNSGNTYIWPTQAQYNRAYSQANLGVTWNAWVEYGNWDAGNLYQAYTGGGTDETNRATIFSTVTNASNSWTMGHTAEDTADGLCTNYKTWGDGSKQCQGHEEGFTTGWSTAWTSYPVTNAITDEKWSDNWATASANTPVSSANKSLGTYPLAYDWRNYMGWHQFVLSEVYDYQNTDPQNKKTYKNFGKFIRNDWYTICYPFNLTRGQLLEIFGNNDKTDPDYPTIYTLEKVRRDSKNTEITIRFSKDLMTNILSYDTEAKNAVLYEGANLAPVYTTRTLTEADGDAYWDEIIVEANKPYFIKPNIPQARIDEYKTTKIRRFAVTLPKLNSGETYFPDLTIYVNAVNANSDSYVTANDEETTDKSKAYRYYFVGNYVRQTLPLYSYYLGSKGGKSYLFRHTSGTKYWGENSAIILGVDPTLTDKYYVKQIERNKNYVVSARGKDDFIFPTTGSSAAKTATFTYLWEDEEGEATNVLFPNEEGSFTTFNRESTVYNISGQAIGKYSSTLPKGIYIVEGKKIVIK